MALLLRSRPDKQGNVKDWLVALSPLSEGQTASDIATWVRKELHAIGLRAYNIETVVADNASTMQALTTELQATYVPCAAHSLDLAIDAAWASIEDRWPSKVQKIIANFNKSGKMIAELNQRQNQAGHPQQKLIGWNDTRWLGKYKAITRFMKVTLDPKAREIVRYDLTEDERMSIADLEPVLVFLAKLTSSLTHESIDVISLGQGNYGNYLKLIQLTYMIVLCILLSIPWHERGDETHYSTWKFGRTLLEELDARFFRSPPDDVLLAYFLDKTIKKKSGFEGFTEITAFLMSRVNSVGDNGFPSGLLEPEIRDFICSVTPMKWTSSTIFNRYNIVAHLCAHFRKVYHRWTSRHFSKEKFATLALNYLERQPFTHSSKDMPSQSNNSALTGKLMHYMDYLDRDTENWHRATDIHKELLEYWDWNLPKQYSNTLEWACDPDTVIFPQLRHIIVQLLSRPQTTVSAEQVFSQVNFQTSPWSTTLNSSDFETRVTVAFNRKNFSRAEYYALMGWSSHIHVFDDHKRVKEELSKQTGLPVGASQARSTVQARAAKAQKRLSLQSNLRSSGSSSSSTVEVIPSRSSKKRTRPINNYIESDGDLENEDQFILSLQSSKRRTLSTSTAGLSANRQEILRQLEEVISSNESDHEAVKNAFFHLMNTSLGSYSNIAAVRRNLETTSGDRVIAAIKSLCENIREGNDISSSLFLLSVELGNSQNNGIISMASTIDITEPQTNQNAEMTVEASGNSTEVFLECHLQEALKASMDDYLKSQSDLREEISSLQNYLTQQDLVLANVPGDGNCLYHALSLALRVSQVENAPSNHIQARRCIVKFMRGQKSTWFQLPNQTTKQAYLEKQSKDGEYGDENVIKAAAELYRRVIHVTSVYEGVRKFDGTLGKRGRKPRPDELFLINMNHYLYGCPRDTCSKLPSNFFLE